MFDAFVDWRPAPSVSLRVGQFFVPFNRTRWIPIARQLFLERSVATQEFNLDRDAGALLALTDLAGWGRRHAPSLGPGSYSHLTLTTNNRGVLW